MMLKRLYIDNFRCLVNFELKLDPINLLLGANSSGKTSVFDVLRRLQDFIIGDFRVHDVFPVGDLTLWQTGGRQRFELEVSSGHDIYAYRLLLERETDRRRMRVFEERLDLNGKPLFHCKDGMAQLYRDEFEVTAPNTKIVEVAAMMIYDAERDSPATGVEQRHIGGRHLVNARRPGHAKPGFGRKE